MSLFLQIMWASRPRNFTKHEHFSSHITPRCTHERYFHQKASLMDVTKWKFYVWVGGRMMKFTLTSVTFIFVGNNMMRMGKKTPHPIFLKIYLVRLNLEITVDFPGRCFVEWFDNNISGLEYLQYRNVLFHVYWNETFNLFLII